MSRARAGFTLVEVLLALGLFSILMVALVRLADTCFTLWSDTELRREQAERASALLERLGRDLRSLEPGAAGDLVCAWETRDADGDGLPGLVLPRLLLVRARSAAETARASDADALAARDRLLRAARAGDRALVLWAFGPAPDAPAPPALLRAEVALDDPAAGVLSALSAAGDVRPLAALAQTREEDVLWLSFRFATATTALEEGWRLDGGLSASAASWDAWSRGRPDPERSGFNEPAPGLLAARDAPLLPRRARVELELELARERAWRPRLSAALEPGETLLRITDRARWPAPGTFLLVDEEWIELVASGGDEASVRRARRGSVERAHAAGTLVHHGRAFALEVPLAGAREAWLR